jgi:hypothetical protein
MPRHLNTEKNEKSWKDASVLFSFRLHFVLISFSVKAKYGSDCDTDPEFSTDSESAESEDENGEELTFVVDAAILRTLARIKKKDPAIYDSQKNIYGGARTLFMCYGCN